MTESQKGNDFIYISIGTFSPTDEDFTLSVHLDGVATHIATLSPQDTRRLLDRCNELMGKDSGEVLKIRLNKNLGIRHRQFAAMLYKSELEIEEE